MTITLFSFNLPRLAPSETWQIEHSLFLLCFSELFWKLVLLHIQIWTERIVNSNILFVPILNALNILQEWKRDCCYVCVLTDLEILFNKNAITFWMDYLFVYLKLFLIQWLLQQQKYKQLCQAMISFSCVLSVI